MTDSAELINRLNELLNLTRTQTRNHEKYNLDNTKRKAIVICDAYLGKNNSYSRDISVINFIDIDYSSPQLLYPEIIKYGSKMANILDELIFKLENGILAISDNNTVDVSAPKTRTLASKSDQRPALLSKKIFIVHGHNNEMKEAVARLIEKIGLKPIILHEQPDKGRTIIKKFEDHADVSFAIVLISPDDPISSGSPDEKFRPRQNVIFEMGYFIGKLGTDCVFTLCKDPKKLDILSDYQGVIYTEYDPHGNWKFKLIRELKACKYDVDINSIL